MLRKLALASNTPGGRLGHAGSRLRVSADVGEERNADKDTFAATVKCTAVPRVSSQPKRLSRPV